MSKYLPDGFGGGCVFLRGSGYGYGGSYGYGCETCIIEDFGYSYGSGMSSERCGYGLNQGFIRSTGTSFNNYNMLSGKEIQNGNLESNPSHK